MDKWIPAALALPVYGQKKEEERVENASAVALAELLQRR